MESSASFCLLLFLSGSSSYHPWNINLSLIQFLALSSLGFPGWACPPTRFLLSLHFRWHQIHNPIWCLTWSLVWCLHQLSVVGWLVTSNLTLERMQDLHSTRCYSVVYIRLFPLFFCSLLLIFRELFSSPAPHPPETRIQRNHRPKWSLGGMFAKLIFSL